MKTLSKSNKKKIIIAVSVLLVVAIIATSLGIYASSAKKQKVTLSQISTGSINESVGATGKVTSGTTKKYSVATVATVKSVLVKTGDVVKKGDTLATFDTSELDAQIVKLRKSYNEAKAEYNKALKQQKQSNSDLAQMDAEIASLEKDIEILRKNISSNASNQANSVEKILVEFSKALGNVSDDEETVNKITEIVMNTIAEEMRNGNFSAESIANKVEENLTKAIANGQIDASKLNSDVNKVVEILTKELEKINWDEFGTSLEDNDAVKLTTNELRLAALTAQREILGATGSIDLVGTRKELMETTKSTLDMLEKSSKELSTGWIAEFDGTITSCDIKPGEQTSALTPGITLQNTEQLVVTISIGEYYINKINVGMKAKITTAYGSYTGSVISKAPTASGGSEGSILDSFGSMAGISGLSSLTDKGAGVEVVIGVDNPDENIIIGFNADVEIETSEYNDIIIVPIQSVVLDKTGKYVYLYNDEEKTVTKTKIEIGATSDSEYQVISGLSLGDKIVDVPLAEYDKLDDTFDVKVMN